MSDLAKNISVRTLTLQLIFVAIIAVSVAGVARHSLLLDWSALVVTFVLLVADPLSSDALSSPDRVDATPATAACRIPQSKEKSAAGIGQLTPRLAPEP